MDIVEILSITGSICSILSLIVATFIASKVVKITANNSGAAKAEGDRNFVVGRDIKNG